jgi:hypothetical protein
MQGTVARPCHNDRIKVALFVLAVGAVVALLIASLANGGCLPWQERVSGYAENAFGRERAATQCRGSWLPFGMAAPVDGGGR